MLRILHRFIALLLIPCLALTSVSGSEFQVASLTRNAKLETRNLPFTLQAMSLPASRFAHPGPTAKTAVKVNQGAARELAKPSAPVSLEGSLGVAVFFGLLALGAWLFGGDAGYLLNVDLVGSLVYITIGFALQALAVGLVPLTVHGLVRLAKLPDHGDNDLATYDHLIRPLQVLMPDNRTAFLQVSEEFQEINESLWHDLSRLPAWGQWFFYALFIWPLRVFHERTHFTPLNKWPKPLNEIAAYGLQAAGPLLAITGYAFFGNAWGAAAGGFPGLALLAAVSLWGHDREMAAWNVTPSGAALAAGPATTQVNPTANAAPQDPVTASRPIFLFALFNSPAFQKVTLGIFRINPPATHPEVPPQAPAQPRPQSHIHSDSRHWGHTHRETPAPAAPPEESSTVEAPAPPLPAPESHDSGPSWIRQEERHKGFVEASEYLKQKMGGTPGVRMNVPRVIVEILRLLHGEPIDRLLTNSRAEHLEGAWSNLKVINKAEALRNFNGGLLDLITVPMSSVGQAIVTADLIYKEIVLGQRLAEIEGLLKIDGLAQDPHTVALLITNYFLRRNGYTFFEFQSPEEFQKVRDNLKTNGVADPSLRNLMEERIKPLHARKGRVRGGPINDNPVSPALQSPPPGVVRKARAPKKSATKVETPPVVKKYPSTTPSYLDPEWQLEPGTGDLVHLSGWRFHEGDNIPNVGIVQKPEMAGPNQGPRLRIAARRDSPFTIYMGRRFDDLLAQLKSSEPLAMTPGTPATREFEDAWKVRLDLQSGPWNPVAYEEAVREIYRVATVVVPREEMKFFKDVITDVLDQLAAPGVNAAALLQTLRAGREGKRADGKKDFLAAHPQVFRYRAYVDLWGWEETKPHERKDLDQLYDTWLDAALEALEKAITTAEITLSPETMAAILESKILELHGEYNRLALRLGHGPLAMMSPKNDLTGRKHPQSERDAYETRIRRTLLNPDDVEITPTDAARVGRYLANVTPEALRQASFLELEERDVEHILNLETPPDRITIQIAERLIAQPTEFTNILASIRPSGAIDPTPETPVPAREQPVIAAQEQSQTQVAGSASSPKAPRVRKSTVQVPVEPVVKPAVKPVPEAKPSKWGSEPPLPPGRHLGLLSRIADTQLQLWHQKLASIIRWALTLDPHNPEPHAAEILRQAIEEFNHLGITVGPGDFGITPYEFLPLIFKGSDYSRRYELSLEWLDGYGLWFILSHPEETFVLDWNDYAEHVIEPFEAETLARRLGRGTSRNAALRDALSNLWGRAMDLANRRRVQASLMPILGFCAGQNPKRVDAATLQDIHARNARFNSDHRIIPAIPDQSVEPKPDGTLMNFTWLPLPNHQMTVRRAVVGALYAIHLEWIEDVGEVIYLSKLPRAGDPGDTTIYFMGPYHDDEIRFAERLARMRDKDIAPAERETDALTSSARVVGHAATLEEAKLLARDELDKNEAGDLLSRALTISPEAALKADSPEAVALAELQRDLAAFHARQPTVRTTVGDDVGLPLTDGASCILENVTTAKRETAKSSAPPFTRYRFELRWVDHAGPIIFLRGARVIVYDPHREGQDYHSPIGRFDSDDEAEEALRVYLEKQPTERLNEATAGAIQALAQAFMAVNMSDAEAVARFKTLIEAFKAKGLHAEWKQEHLAMRALKGSSIALDGMPRDVPSEPVPEWIENYGPVLYIKSSEEAVGFDLRSFRDAVDAGRKGRVQAFQRVDIHDEHLGEEQLYQQVRARMHLAIRIRQAAMVNAADPAAVAAVEAGLADFNRQAFRLRQINGYRMEISPAPNHFVRFLDLSENVDYSSRIDRDRSGAVMVSWTTTGRDYRRYSLQDYESVRDSPPNRRNFVSLQPLPGISAAESLAMVAHTPESRRFVNAWNAWVNFRIEGSTPRKIKRALERKDHLLKKVYHIAMKVVPLRELRFFEKIIQEVLTKLAEPGADAVAILRDLRQSRNGKRLEGKTTFVNAHPQVFKYGAGGLGLKNSTRSDQQKLGQAYDQWLDAALLALEMAIGAAEKTVTTLTPDHIRQILEDVIVELHGAYNRDILDGIIPGPMAMMPPESTPGDPAALGAFILAGVPTFDPLVAGLALGALVSLWLLIRAIRQPRNLSKQYRGGIWLLPSEQMTLQLLSTEIGNKIPVEQVDLIDVGSLGTQNPSVWIIVMMNLAEGLQDQQPTVARKALLALLPLVAAWRAQWMAEADRLPTEADRVRKRDAWRVQLRQIRDSAVDIGSHPLVEEAANTLRDTWRPEIDGPAAAVASPSEPAKPGPSQNRFIRWMNSPLSPEGFRTLFIVTPFLIQLLVFLSMGLARSHPVLAWVIWRAVPLMVLLVTFRIRSGMIAWARQQAGVAAESDPQMALKKLLQEYPRDRLRSVEARDAWDSVEVFTQVQPSDMDPDALAKARHAATTHVERALKVATDPGDIKALIAMLAVLEGNSGTGSTPASPAGGPGPGAGSGPVLPTFQQSLLHEAA